MVRGLDKKVLAVAMGLVAMFSLGVFAPVKDAAAEPASVTLTVSGAEARCENLHDGSFKSKYWKVSGKKDSKTGKCTDVKKANKQKCKDAGGDPSKVKDGKLTCTWTGLKDEVNPDEVGSGANNTTSDTSSVGNIGAKDNECGDGVKTSILGDGGCYTDDGKGSGVYEILLIVLNILTAGVGVLGVLGLVVSGITYLTARDNEQQVAKAKQRILQIVIGLAIFAVLYVALQWLIPGGIFGE